MAGDTHLALRPTIFVDELVTVGSQSITSSVVESTIVELPVARATVVVVVQSFDRKVSNWLLTPWSIVQYAVYVAGMGRPRRALCIS